MRMGVDQADRESLQAAVRLTIASGDDLAFSFDTGWGVSGPERWADILGLDEHSSPGRAVSKVVEFVESSPRINRVGMRGLMRGRINFRTQEAHYRNGSGPWRVARGSEVRTASENGETEGPPRGEPSPFDVIDALGAMEVEHRREGRAAVRPLRGTRIGSAGSERAGGLPATRLVHRATVDGLGLDRRGVLDTPDQDQGGVPGPGARGRNEHGAGAEAAA